MADVTMPQLGETVTEGTVTRWMKAIGDTVARDEPLFEVSTDKVDSEVPSPAAGVVAEGTGVTVSERGFFEVDEHCRTGEPGVWAVGDCIATPQLAHVGFIEGINVIKDILGENPPAVDYGKVPWAIYCHPEVAWVGPDEEAAKAAGHDVVVAKHQFRSNSRAQIIGELDGLVKIIAKKNADGTAGQILGVHMVGPWVTALLGAGYLAVNWEATPEEVAQFIQPHPSLSEAFGETVLALTGRGLHVG